MNKLQKALSSVAMLGALTGSANAADYVQENRWGLFGAGHTITQIHTEPGFISVPQRVLHRDACGNCYEGIGMVQRPAEIITNRCRTRYVEWDKSILAAPGNLLSAIGNAITPKGRGPGHTNCYTAPHVTAPNCNCR